MVRGTQVNLLLFLQVLQSIKGCQAELALLRDRSASAWEALLRHYGETKQSCPTDTEFWADMQVRLVPLDGRLCHGCCCASVCIITS
jgi:hypothetical protein